LQIPHIPNAILNLLRFVEVPHIILFLFIAAEDADLLKIIAIQVFFEHGVAERTGAAGDK